MNTIARTTVPPKSKTDKAQRIELYDRYGSMAYGIILNIVPQPEVAQKILVDLFATLSIDEETSARERESTTIIQLARAKALANRPSSSERSLTSFHPTERNLPKVVFNLSFWHGCNSEEIAERLHITTNDVLRAIRTYVKSFTTA
ncbi:hypothetical protein [Spirosoma rhododendri]|uniref:Sigma-70 family RNA polymerase sigma factor n=1 Tax=Spirosoma rhododendri TaxID=2728024 RepID=A0A7L5DJD7_9BACT|nr:hypothetical protein [Spirosoma rhododendri]QJD78529.1 hypothetical protein HH216_08905 [Spirosoma rhododendri]